jgi:hypothetical protein
VHRVSFCGRGAPSGSTYPGCSLSPRRAEGREVWGTIRRWPEWRRGYPLFEPAAVAGEVELGVDPLYAVDHLTGPALDLPDELSSLESEEADAAFLAGDGQKLAVGFNGHPHEIFGLSIVVDRVKQFEFMRRVGLDDVGAQIGKQIFLARRQF